MGVLELPTRLTASPAGMWSPQGRLESSQEHADLFLSVLLTVDYQLHAFQKTKNNSNKRNPNLWRVCCRYPFLFRETLNTSAFTVMSGPILGRSSRLMENVVVFCIHDYYLKMYSCHKLFLWLQVNFFFFPLQAWAGDYSPCLVDRLLEIYLEGDTLCPGW